MATDWKDLLGTLRESFEEHDSKNLKSGELMEQKEEKNSQTSVLHIILDKKGRNGKIATIIEGFTLSYDEVQKIASDLKKTLGVGGSSREGEILIQGDHKNAVAKFLNELGFKTKFL